MYYNIFMRKLASIQKIAALEPIEGADKIEKATILGWHLVVKKGEFNIGDPCVYFEVDSLLPLESQFSFLDRGGNKKKILLDGKEIEGYRLKTIRLRGQVSQGLALPLSEFPQLQNVHEGDDVSELLHVYKYEPPMPANLVGKAKGMRPDFVPKTDEMRIQTVPQVLERHKGVECYVSEKVDGSSISVYYHEKQFGVCSRNLELLQDDENTLWKTALDMELDKKLAEIGRNLVLQGEITGEGIQKNTLKIKGQTIYFFSAYDPDTRTYLDFDAFVDLMKQMGLPTVPIIDDHFILDHTVDSLVAYATRKSMANPDSWAEGVVIRSKKEMYDEELGRLSFKVVNPEFLLG